MAIVTAAVYIPLFCIYVSHLRKRFIFPMEATYAIRFSFVFNTFVHLYVPAREGKMKFRELRNTERNTVRNQNYKRKQKNTFLINEPI